ncbi:MAG: formyltransferase family protein [Chitinophagaceae bacterium]
MKIVFLVGAQTNQTALVAKVSALVLPSHIIVEKRKGMAKSFIDTLLQKSKALLTYPLHHAWANLMKFYGHYHFPVGVPQTTVENINHAEVLKIIDKIRPDFILVSGTRLIKNELIESVSPYCKIINLHTGLSPYIKGGPNCTNWCLATNQVEYIGNTMMWLNKGIDSGNIITTALVPLAGIKSLSSLHIKVMEHAHGLYCDVIRKALKQEALPDVRQSEISQGHTYYSKEWTLKMQWKAIANFYSLFINNKKGVHSDPNITLVDL